MPLALSSYFHSQLHITLSRAIGDMADAICELGDGLRNTEYGICEYVREHSAWPSHNYRRLWRNWVFGICANCL